MSHMMLYFTTMYLVHFQNILFLDTHIETHQNFTAPCLNSKSSSQPLSQIASLIAYVTVIYSVFVVESATTGSKLEAFMTWFDEKFRLFLTLRSRTETKMASNSMISCPTAFLKKCHSISSKTNIGSMILRRVL